MYSIYTAPQFLAFFEGSAHDGWRMQTRFGSVVRFWYEGFNISHAQNQHVNLNKTTILPDLEGKSSIFVSYRAITKRAVEVEAMLTP